MTQHLFLLFFIGFILYYSLVINKNIVKTYFIITGIVIVLLYYQKKKEKEKRLSINIESFINNIEKESKNKQYEFEHIHGIYKVSNLKYIKKSKELKTILYRMNIYKVYNRHAIYDIVCLIEYFLKYHYYVMSGVYDLSYYDILKDIKKEVLNTAYSMYHNFRRFSNITKRNLDEYHLDTIYKLEVLLSNYLRIVQNKYNIEDFDQDTIGFNNKYHLV